MQILVLLISFSFSPHSCFASSVHMHAVAGAAAGKGRGVYLLSTPPHPNQACRSVCLLSCSAHTGPSSCALPDKQNCEFALVCTPLTSFLMASTVCVQLSRAVDLDESSPLQAAEHYARAVKFFNKALQEGVEPGEAERAQGLVVRCRERFDDCEKRVQQQKAIDVSIGSSHSHSHNPAPTSSAGNAPNRQNWVETFQDLFSYRRPGAAGNDAVTHAAQTKHSVPLSHPPARTPPMPPPAGLPATSVQSFPPDKPRSQTKNVHQTASGESPPATRSGGNSHGGPSQQPRQGAQAGAKAKGEVKSALKGVDTALAKMILDEVLDVSPGIAFDDIVGLKEAKEALREAIVLPAMRPDLFHGIRAPPKGILLFGPPGNGKTMLAKAVASECASRFFSISASSLTSKWVGQAEKMVRALFAVAAEVEPTVIFIDEADSILAARSDNENEASRYCLNPTPINPQPSTLSENESSRRLKTEFLVQFDGASTAAQRRVVFIAATNRPHELDEAVIRRFTRQIPNPKPQTQSTMRQRLSSGA
jgi:predicted AAA+ superfamily ATPase